MAKEAVTRLYEVVPDQGPSVLVEAATASAALRLVTARRYTVTVASAKRVLQLRDANCEVVMVKGANE
jgi:hypothetical protein